MSVSQGRLLTRDEQVDHINDDKTDDSIENLQILSAEANKRKQEDLYRQTHQLETELKCPVCDASFMISSRNYRYHTNKGRVNFCCSRSCSVKLQHIIKRNKT